jgi:hypothetical protein
MQNFAPIALFVYNRPQHTRRTINFLKQNLLADESRLYIFSDAAKTTKEENDVLEVRNMIKEVEGFKSVKIVERNTNFGLANSIISGVSQLVKDYGKVIVFEDDLLSSPYTLQYFNEALQKYQNEDKVMHISAYMYPLKEANKLPETFLYRAAHSWGWATWERAWQHFNPDIDALLEKFDAKRKYEFSIEGTMNFWKQMQDFKNKKNNSWAIRWYASIFLMNGLCLNPSKSLIHNIGHDGSGIHSNIEKTYAVNIHKNPITQFPTMIEENQQAYPFIKHFLSKRKGNIFKRIVKYISTSISKLR